MIRIVRVLALAVAAIAVTGFRATSHRSSFILAGEPIRFDGKRAPQYSANQSQHTTDATREGLARWAATAEGQKVIAFLDHREFHVTIAEDTSEDSPGRAPQPSLGTLVAASDHGVVKLYTVVLNPTFGAVKGFTILPGQPSTPGDIMATAWAAEMLHVYYYSRGISLPHHKRPDFQEEWRAVACELGFPAVRHEDEAEQPERSGPQIIYW